MHSHVGQAARGGRLASQIEGRRNSYEYGSHNLDETRLFPGQRKA